MKKTLEQRFKKDQVETYPANSTPETKPIQMIPVWKAVADVRQFLIHEKKHCVPTSKMDMCIDILLTKIQ